MSYDQHTFAQVLDVLRRNRRRISVDPRRRDFQDRLRSDYERSLARLKRVSEKIAALDGAIDAAKAGDPSGF